MISSYWPRVQGPESPTSKAGSACEKEDDQEVFGGCICRRKHGPHEVPDFRREGGVPQHSQALQGHAEFVHAKNHFIALGNLGKTPENLQAGIDGETYEVEEMYPVFHNAAEFQGENEAVRTTHYALEAEKIHAGLYARAKELAENGKDIEIKKVYICPVCGYTAVDEAPEYCPVCGAPRDKFVVFE